MEGGRRGKREQKRGRGKRARERGREEERAREIYIP